MTLLEEVSNGNLDALKAFIKQQPKPANFKKELISPICGTSVLSKAAERGHTEIVRYLLGCEDLPIQIWNPNVFGYSPLELAEHHGHREAARLLLWSKGKTVTYEALNTKCKTGVKKFIETTAKLGFFFRGVRLDDMLTQVVNRATDAAWGVGDLGVGVEDAIGLSLLTIYDVVILIDDSGSMEFEEEGRRVTALRLGLKAIAKVHSSLSREHAASSTIEKSGIKRIQFMNRPLKGKALNNAKNIVDPNEIDTLIKKHRFGGSTPIGTALKTAILDPFIFTRKSEFVKPLLIMVITDGGIDLKEKDILIRNIDESVKELQGKHNVPKDAQAIVFQFVLVGEDKLAEKMLHQLSNHKTIGRYVHSSTTDWDSEDILYMSDNNKRQKMLDLMVSALEIREPDEDSEDENVDDDV